jgi:hypothetical protein
VRIGENGLVVFWFVIAAITVIGAIGGVGALVSLGRYAPHD